MRPSGIARGPVREGAESRSASFSLKFHTPLTLPSRLHLPLATKVGAWPPLRRKKVTHTHTQTHTFLSTQAVTDEAEALRWGPGPPDVGMQTEVLKWAKAGKRWRGRKGKEGRIGMGFPPPDKHIHPHYCNNPLATHQCSISLPLSVSIGRPFSFTLTHTDTLTAGNTFQMGLSVRKKKKKSRISVLYCAHRV